MKFLQRKTVFVIIFITIYYVPTYAQKFRFLGHVFYGGASFVYDENQYLNQTIKTNAIPAYGIQTSVQFVISESFRIGTGLNYLRMKGKTEPVFVDKNLLNTNSTGDFTMDVNSSYLQVPFEFLVTLAQKWKIKPFLVGGLKLYIPLKEYYFAKIDPVTPSPYYRKIEATINQGKEYRGLFIGSGIILPLNKNREMELRLSYLANSFFYETIVPGTTTVTEESSLKFKILELSVGISLF